MVADSQDSLKKLRGIARDLSRCSFASRGTRNRGVYHEPLR